MKPTVRFLGFVAVAALTWFSRAAAAETAAPLGSTFFDWDAIPAQPTPLGAYRKVADGPAATIERLEFHITTLRPGMLSHPPHHHPQEELLLIKEGTVESSINGRTARVGPGSVLFFAAHDVHNVRNVGPKPATYYVINFYTAATAAVRNQAAAEWAPPGMQPSAAIDWEKLAPKSGANDTRRTLIDSPTLTFKRLEIHATTLPPGLPGTQAHRDNGPTLVIMKEGTMAATVDGVTGLIGNGSILFIAAHSMHSMRNPGPGPATYFVFSVES